MRAVDAGTVLEARYRLERVLGRGGMGVVYAATRLDLGRPVAIKVLDVALSEARDALAATEREARAAGQLAHPHIVQVIDFSGGSDGPPYLVMELLEGESLDARLSRVHRLDAASAALVTVQVLAALHAAHAHGIQHRDVKPANIFLCRTATSTNFVKLLDFGLARGASAVESARKPAMHPGTPAYMSPEQVRGEMLDARSDVWSAGVCLYEMMAGATPHDAASTAALLMRICTTPAPRIEERCPWIDPALARLVHRALAFDPSERFASASEMRAELAPFAAHAAVPSREFASRETTGVGDVLGATLEFADAARPATRAETTFDGAHAPTMPLMASPRDAGRTLASTESATLPPAPSSSRTTWAAAATLAALCTVAWYVRPRPTMRATPPQEATAEGCTLGTAVRVVTADVETIRLAASDDEVLIATRTRDGRVRFASAKIGGPLEPWPSPPLLQDDPGFDFLPCATVRPDGELVAGGARVARPALDFSTLLRFHRPSDVPTVPSFLRLDAVSFGADEVVCVMDGAWSAFVTRSSRGRMPDAVGLTAFNGPARAGQTFDFGETRQILADAEGGRMAIAALSRAVVHLSVVEMATMNNTLAMSPTAASPGESALLIRAGAVDLVSRREPTGLANSHWSADGAPKAHKVLLPQQDVHEPRLAHRGEGVVAAWLEPRDAEPMLHVGMGPTVEAAFARSTERPLPAGARGLVLAGGKNPWVAWLDGEARGATLSPLACAP